MMSYEKKWNTLAELLMELKKKEEKIPLEIMEDLRSANTIIQVLKVDSTSEENRAIVDEYLRNVESYVIFTGEKFGTETVEEWLKKIKEAKNVEQKGSHVQPRFVHGVPRDKNWVQIQISKDISKDIIVEKIQKNGLSYVERENGQIIVYGNKENIKSLVKRVAKQLRDLRDN
jgi:hypothetical protein